MPSQRMILIASEQVWPNLHALLHWSDPKRGQLEEIFILHTAAEEASKIPANRLLAVIEASRDQPFHFGMVELREIDTTPTGVAKCVKDLIDRNKSDQWIVVANGGLKTMTLGLLDAMSRDNVQVVYSEIGGRWQRQRLDPQTLQVTSESLPELMPGEMDRLPVVKLLEAQHIGPNDRFRLDPGKVPDMDLNRFVSISRKCMTQDDPPNWDWRAGFEQPQGSLGFLFEDWFGGLLLALGVTNRVTGLRIRGENDQLDANESDFLAIHQGKFFLIELKLRNDQLGKSDPDINLNEILRKASGLARNFAGYGGVPLVLIPNWLLTKGQKELCRLYSPQPRVLDASLSQELIPWTAQQLGIQQLPDELIQLNQEIQNWMQDHQLSRIFGPEAPVRRAGRDHGQSVVLSLPNVINEYRRESGQNWVIWEYGQELRLRIPKPPNTDRPPDFRNFGENFWDATYRCEDATQRKQIKAKLNQRFATFCRQSPASEELIRAWREALKHPPQITEIATARGPEARPQRAQALLDIRQGSWTQILNGPNWCLEKRTEDGRFRLTAHIGKNGSLGGLSVNHLSQAVAQNINDRPSVNQPWLKLVLFKEGLPIDKILGRFNGQPFDGQAMANHLRNLPDNRS